MGRGVDCGTKYDTQGKHCLEVIFKPRLEGGEGVI